MSPTQPKKLLYREWTTAALVLGLIGSVFFYSWSYTYRFKSPAQQVQFSPAKISLTLEGAIERPGTYSFNPGITLKEVLREVHLTKSADRKRVDFKKVFYVSQDVHIPQKTSASKLTSN